MLVVTMTGDTMTVRFQGMPLTRATGLGVTRAWLQIQLEEYDSLSDDHADAAGLKPAYNRGRSRLPNEPRAICSHGEGGQAGGMRPTAVVSAAPGHETSVAAGGMDYCP